MPAGDFHGKGFDEGTLTKLRVFELYTREWLPVFLSAAQPRRKRIDMFDFFAGPGTDIHGEMGSPLRLLRQLKEYRELPGWRNADVAVHFYDRSAESIRSLDQKISDLNLRFPEVKYDVRPMDFADGFQAAKPLLCDKDSAKLVFIDQFGVDHVTPDVFRTLARSPRCDFLFFLSSSTLYRFRDHPAIKQKIVRPEDYHHVHRAALNYYRGLLPGDERYFLAPFSIKKGSNIYGLIFGSAHPLGIDKFLQVAWGSDAINGEADFDIHRDNIGPGELLLDLEEMRPSKVAAFERELERLLRDGKLKTESDVMEVCFDHGVRRQHAERVLRKLKEEGIIQLSFRVPDVHRWASPREVRMR